MSITRLSHRVDTHDPCQNNVTISEPVPLQGAREFPKPTSDGKAHMIVVIHLITAICRL